MTALLMLMLSHVEGWVNNISIGWREPESLNERRHGIARDFGGRDNDHGVFVVAEEHSFSAVLVGLVAVAGFPFTPSFDRWRLVGFVFVPLRQPAFETLLLVFGVSADRSISSSTSIVLFGIERPEAWIPVASIATVADSSQRVGNTSMTASQQSSTTCRRLAWSLAGICESGVSIHDSPVLIARAKL